MAIKTRSEALSVLGLPYNASDDMIKTAYRSLAKLYHPDAADSQLSWQYEDIVEAYDFLKKNTSSTTAHILGPSSEEARRYAMSKKASQAIKKAKASEKKRKEMRQEELRLEAMAIREAEAQAEKKRQQVSKEALDHIRAIQMADMISNMLSDSDTTKL